MSCLLNRVYAAAARAQGGCRYRAAAAAADAVHGNADGDSGHRMLNVGASFGWHAIAAAAAGCSVIAYEPFLPSFQLLQVVSAQRTVL